MAFSILTQELAIDLGTANTVIFMNDKKVIDEPSIVAIDAYTDKPLAVGTRGAVELAGSDTVAVVGGHEQLHRDLAGAYDALTLGVDDHTLGALSGAGTQKLRDALGFDDAQSAGAVDLDRLVIAQGGDVDTVRTRGF